MMKIKNPTEPIEDFLYCIDGVLYWKKTKHKSKIDKPVADRPSKNGYKTVKICGRSLLQHRVVWYLNYGVWPSILDHIDGDKSNNKLDNLREATHSQNFGNRKPVCNKMYSDYKGVSKYRKHKWKAVCQGVYLGTFDNEELAAKAYDKQATLVWGEFAKTNYKMEHFDDE